jgi:DNA/RNA-binding protein KIN17
MEEEEQRKLSISVKRTKQNQSQYLDRRREEETEREGEGKREEEADSTSPSWLHRQIIVKILNKKLANGRYYKAKGVIEDITGEGFVAIIRLLIESDTGEVSSERIKVDQEELETVIPQVICLSLS